MGLTVVLALPSNGMKLDMGPWCPTEGWPNDCSPLPEQYACGLSSLKDRDLQGRWNTYKQEVKPLSLCTVPFFLVGGSDGDCTRTAEIWNPSFFFFFFCTNKTPNDTLMLVKLSICFMTWKFVPSTRLLLVNQKQQCYLLLQLPIKQALMTTCCCPVSLTSKAVPYQVHSFIKCIIG